MFLSGATIKGFIEKGEVLEGAVAENVGAISYDLRTQCFFTKDGQQQCVTLDPGESVYVAAVEILDLPRDLSAIVSLRNSRMREGLSLDAPVYFPGHHTRVFFRVTNVSSSSIHLESAGAPIAQILFERVEGNVESSYSGAFTDELDYKGLGDYSDIYKDEIKKLDSKRDELLGMESRIYERTIALLAIFAAVFTLVNVNARVEIASNQLFVVNLSIIGGFSALVGLIGIVLKTESVWARILPFVLAVAAFAAAILI